MKGLLLKDFYLLRNYCWTFLLFVLVFAVISVTTDIPFFLFYPCILMGVLPMTLQSYDEKEKWTVYSGTLPYSKAQLVSVKYIMGIFLSAFALILVAIIQAIQMVRSGAFNLEGFLTMLVFQIGVGLVPSGLLLPFTFRLGAEKARLAYYCLVGFICGMTVFLTSFFAIEDGVVLPFAGTMALVFIGVGAVVLYALSWAVSISWYKKREM